jgi:hypothetical protein
MGVPLYVNEGMGKVLLRKVLVDKEKIAELKEVLTVDYRRENSLVDFKMLIGPIFYSICHGCLKYLYDECPSDLTGLNFS